MGRGSGGVAGAGGEGTPGEFNSMLNCGIRGIASMFLSALTATLAATAEGNFSRLARRAGGGSAPKVILDCYFVSHADRTDLIGERHSTYPTEAIRI